MVGNLFYNVGQKFAAKSSQHGLPSFSNWKQHFNYISLFCITAIKTIRYFLFFSATCWIVRWLLGWSVSSLPTSITNCLQHFLWKKYYCFCSKWKLKVNSFEVVFFGHIVRRCCRHVCLFCGSLLFFWPCNWKPPHLAEICNSCWHKRQIIVCFLLIVFFFISLHSVSFMAISFEPSLFLLLAYFHLFVVVGLDDCKISLHQPFDLTNDKF